MDEGDRAEGCGAFARRDDARARGLWAKGRRTEGAGPPGIVVRFALVAVIRSDGA